MISRTPWAHCLLIFSFALLAGRPAGADTSSWVKVFSRKANPSGNSCVIALSPNEPARFPNATLGDQDPDRYLTDASPLWRLNPSFQASRTQLNRREVQDILKLDEKTKPRGLEDIIEDTAQLRAQVRNAFNFIASVDTSRRDAQITLATAWEEFAKELMQHSQFSWLAYRFFGDDGSIGYRGEGSKGIVFTRDGHVYRGSITRVSEENIWNSDYTLLEKLR